MQNMFPSNGFEATSLCFWVSTHTKAPAMPNTMPMRRPVERRSVRRMRQMM